MADTLRRWPPLAIRAVLICFMPHRMAAAQGEGSPDINGSGLDLNFMNGRLCPFASKGIIMIAGGRSF